MSKVKKILLISVPAILFVWFLFCLPRHLFRAPLSATAVSADGTLLGARISADGQWCFPPADHVPEKFAKCIVAFEDKRFWLHGGVDPLSAARALVQNTDLSAAEIAEKSLRIAASICVFTNDHIIVETL